MTRSAPVHDSLRSGADDSLRSGADDSLRSGADDSLRSGADDSLRSGADDSLRSLRRRSLQAVAVSFVFLLGIISAIGFVVRPDYVAIVPGSARDTEPLVMVEGTPFYPSDGELLYTTIRLRQDMDLWSYLWTKWRGDSEIIPSETYFGTQTPDESRQANLERMTDSKDVAVAVALDHLGYETITDAGVVVANVVEGSPADGRLQRGDVFDAIDGEPVTSDVQLLDLLGDYAPGDAVEFDVTRGVDGSREIVRITLAENPERPGVGFIGIGPVTLADLLDPPFDVDIDSGSVGGPSAGLAFTLAILDALTPGELSGGAKIAVTGTMGIDGRVGAIGGIEQKAVAVRKSGASIFLVPSAQTEEQLAVVRERVGDDVEVLAVADLDGALDALRSIGGDVDAIEEFAMAQG